MEQLKQPQNKMNYYMTKLLDIVFSRHLQDPSEFSCPSLVEGRSLPAPHPFVQAVERDFIPIGWSLSLDAPRSCQLSVLSSLDRSLGFLQLLLSSDPGQVFIVINLLSDNLTKTAACLFNVS